MKPIYAPHLIVDCLSPKLTKKEIKKMLLDICGIAKMFPISKPFAVKGAEYNPGVSGFIFIEFSNICIHTFEKGNRVGFNLDLFSCKDFTISKVITYLRKKGCTEIDYRRIWREMKA